MKKIYYVWLLFFVIATACARAGSLQGKTVLFVYDGWDGHDPKECREVFVRTVNAQ